MSQKYKKCDYISDHECLSIINSFHLDVYDL